MTMMKMQRGPLVLVVQSDVVSGAVVTEELEQHGFAVSGPFDNCGQALFRMTMDHPDFAVLDSSLRDGSCASLAAELFNRSIPFLVHAEEAERKNAPEYFRGVPWICRFSPRGELAKAVKMLAKGPEGPMVDLSYVAQAVLADRRKPVDR